VTTGIRTSNDDFLAAVDHLAAADFEAALPLLARVVAFDPANEDAYVLWVACHAGLSRNARAIELADAGLARGIAPPDLHLEKGRALRALGQLDEAARAASAALELDPLFSDAVLALARIEMERSNFDEAMAVYEDALRRNPADEEVHFALLELLRDQDRYPRLIESARDFLRTFDKDPDVLGMLGHAYLATGEHRRADRAFRDAARLEPDVVEHHVNVTMLALLINDRQAYDIYLDKLAEQDEDLAEQVARETSLLLEEMVREAREGE
jgi:tetratricopeptide (TPR) repeat protein